MNIHPSIEFPSSNSDLEARARKYEELFHLRLDFATPLGHGRDGKVWKSTVDTAVKVYAKYKPFATELACYRRLQEKRINKIMEFSIPEFVRFHGALGVIEMQVVSPPFLIDFGIATVDDPPRYSEEIMAQERRGWKKNFGSRYPRVLTLVACLEMHGIYYLDPHPGNIRWGDEEERGDSPSSPITD